MLFDTTQLALERTIQGAALRQVALANNLANANTPGFKRSDVDFQGALANAFARTDRGAAAIGGTPFAVEQETGTTVRADGSNVDVDTEMSSLAQNSLAYTAFTSVMSARIKILESAMGAR